MNKFLIKYKKYIFAVIIALMVAWVLTVEQWTSIENVVNSFSTWTLYSTGYWYNLTK
jgi:phosphotransferase system  glucose/maltose/N-acetylglucosamine-specific IIC component